LLRPAVDIAQAQQKGKHEDARDFAFEHNIATSLHRSSIAISGEPCPSDSSRPYRLARNATFTEVRCFVQVAGDEVFAIIQVGCILEKFAGQKSDKNRLH